MEEKYYQLLNKDGSFTADGDDAFSYVFNDIKESIYVVEELRKVTPYTEAYILTGGICEIEGLEKEEALTKASKFANKTKEECIYTIFSKKKALCHEERYFGHHVGTLCRDPMSEDLMLLPIIVHEKKDNKRSLEDLQVL